MSVVAKRPPYGNQPQGIQNIHHRTKSSFEDVSVFKELFFVPRFPEQKVLEKILPENVPFYLNRISIRRNERVPDVVPKEALRRI